MNLAVLAVPYSEFVLLWLCVNFFVFPFLFCLSAWNDLAAWLGVGSFKLQLVRRFMCVFTSRYAGLNPVVITEMANFIKLVGWL